MLTFLYILYYYSKTFSLVYFILSYLLAFFIFHKHTKYYFPDLEDKIDPFYHHKYQGFYRKDGHHISFRRILWGVLTYLWIKVILTLIVCLVWYLYFK